MTSGFGESLGTIGDTPDRDGPGSQPVLRLVCDLSRELASAGISYCHWKSNESIDRSLRGENDLDLLVARSDSHRFSAILHDLGFFVARPKQDRQIPGIVDFFGLDDPSGTVVHAQAHYSLVLGDDMTKNFHLPIEEAYLESCRTDTVLPLPSPNFEYLVFLLRMVVKHCPWDAQLGLKGRLTPSEKRELAFLEARIDPTEVERIRSEHVPTLSAELLSLCRQGIEPRAGAIKRAMAGSRLLEALRPYGRRPPLADLRLRMWRRSWRRTQRSLLGSDTRRRPDAGGLLVGVVGGDGSGKSTAVDRITASLEHYVVCRQGHLGKPPRSLPTRIAARLIRRLGTNARTSLPAWTDFEATGFPGYHFVIWHTLVARDRMREYRRLRHFAGGGVVVCDRFPLDGIRLMDNARIRGLPGLDRRPLARLLSALEEGYYRRIAPPDLLLVMRVSPQVAVRRRPEQDQEFVWRRAEEVFDHRWSEDRVVVIDADRPLDEVTMSARRAVWRRV